MTLVLRGTVVTMNNPDANGGDVIKDGCVYIGDDGLIEDVLSASAPPPSGFTKAPKVTTGGVIWPGLIDLHSHIAYNTLPLWEAQNVPYKDHNQWTRDDEYHSKVVWPSRALLGAAPEALLTYVEVKALIGGTTTIQGSPSATRPVDGWLVRPIDAEKFGTDVDRVRVSVLQKRVEVLNKDAEKLENGLVLIYHVGEGLQNEPLMHREFTDLETAGCVGKRLIGVHATALTTAEFKKWDGGAIAWSPFSNLWLYQVTTDVKSASKQKLRICLGSDWSPSGTKHVLGELKVASIFNADTLDKHFTDAELCAMVTSNPGDALAVATHTYTLGRIQRGAMADIGVFEKRGTNPYRGLISARERDVRLVLVGGATRYGHSDLVSACGGRNASQITIDGQKRSIITRLPNSSDKSLTWGQTLRRLAAVRKNPTAALNDALNALVAFGGSLDDPDAPLVLLGDMPEGDDGLLAGTTDVPADIVVPPMDSLIHDDEFFAACDRTGEPHLAKLQGFYQ
jgi:5-methylthioadenosine/S-adenosylhomocysteine deaminase